MLPHGAGLLQLARRRALHAALLRHTPATHRVSSRLSFSSGASSSTDGGIKSPTIMGLRVPKILLKESITAEPGFNRWTIPPFAIGMHLCIGSVYSWSVFNEPLTRVLGGVASASADWGMVSVMPIFGVAIASLGLSAALGSRVLEEVGPRCTGVMCASLWGGGHLVAAAGISMHSLPLVIGGYGIIGGAGLGLGYVSPVGTLVRWFPDRKGMAAGFAVAGFGGGAIVGKPLNCALLSYFFQPPQRLGTLGDAAGEVHVQTIEGVRYAEVDSVLREVVVATPSDVGPLGLDAGVYLVGTGSAGVAETFATLGCGYAAVITACALMMRVPAPAWVPEGTSQNDSSKQIVPTRSVSMDLAIKTPQFWFLWTALGCNIAGGLGFIGMSTTIMKDMFANALPAIVTPAFCGNFVVMIAAVNILGRLGWASASDYIGRKNIVTMYLGVGSLLYLGMPQVALLVGDGQTLPLMMFVGSSMVVFSFYGGMFATMPAYLGDLYGPQHVGGIHGRLLTTWSVAGVVAPQAVAGLRERSAHRACLELSSVIDPVVFEDKFGAPVTQLEMLMASKSVTLSRLVELLPPNVQDPTPYLHNDSLTASASLLAVGFIANRLIVPVKPEMFNLSSLPQSGTSSSSREDTLRLARLSDESKNRSSEPEQTLKVP